MHALHEKPSAVQYCTLTKVVVLLHVQESCQISKASKQSAATTAMLPVLFGSHHRVHCASLAVPGPWMNSMSVVLGLSADLASQPAGWQAPQADFSGWRELRMTNLVAD